MYHVACTYAALLQQPGLHQHQHTERAQAVKQLGYRVQRLQDCWVLQQAMPGSPLESRSRAQSCVQECKRCAQQQQPKQQPLTVSVDTVHCCKDGWSYGQSVVALVGCPQVFFQSEGVRVWGEGGEKVAGHALSHAPPVPHTPCAGTGGA